MKITFKLILFVTLPLFGVAQQTTGLFQYDWQTDDGYVLWTSLRAGRNQFLMNNCGEVVHTWSSPNSVPANSLYLLEDGSLIYPARSDTAQNNPIAAGGGGEGIMKKDWDGNELWHYVYYDSDRRLHHDIEPMPNGNVLAIAWVIVDSLSAIAAGRKPSLISESVLFTERIIEIEPTGPTTGNIVWQWDIWDHLIQDFDPSKENYGVVEDHPELLDINWTNEFLLEDTGRADIIHMNSVDYNAELDQIVMSARVQNEIWIIDHSTTTAEAAGHTGGDYGKGGDLLYRYGNPQVYGRGDSEDQKLWRQHDANWIPEGYVDAGGIMIYNNGQDRPVSMSEVDVITPPQTAPGVYSLNTGEPYGPEELTWNYHAPDSTSFYSFFISGSTRTQNGNTMICEGLNGRIFEVTHEGEKVWEYVNPLITGDTLSSTEPLEPGDNLVFRAERYPELYPAFIGKDLSNGVQLEANPILGSCLVGVDDFHDMESTRIYPNPTIGELTLEGLEGYMVFIYDLNGRMVRTLSVVADRFNLDLSDEVPGLYLLDIQKNGKRLTKTVMVK